MEPIDQAMYIQPAIARIQEISHALEESVRAVLKVPACERVFVGNIEKIFVGKLMGASADNLPPSTLKTFNCLFDHIERVRAGSNALQDSSSPRRTSIAFYRWLYRAQSVSARLWPRRRMKTIYHFAAHLRADPHVTPNLTDLASIPSVKSPTLRKNLAGELKQRLGEDDLLPSLCELFPTCYLEGYRAFARAPLGESQPRLVYSSIYGLMSDPILAHVVKNSGASLRYVQHGGTYGFSRSWEYEIEREGCDEMVYWGVGPSNVFPTRYALWGRAMPRDRHDSVAIVLLNRREARSDILEIKRKLSNRGLDVKVYGHPRVSSYVDCDFIGIGELEHCAKRFVIFDSFHHSLLYARLINRRPFFVLDGETLEPDYPQGQRFVENLRTRRIIASASEIVDGVCTGLNGGPQPLAFDHSDLLPSERLFERDT